MLKVKKAGRHGKVNFSLKGKHVTKELFTSHMHSLIVVSTGLSPDSYLKTARLRYIGNVHPHSHRHSKTRPSPGSCLTNRS